VRSIDKKINLQKVNILVEQRYLTSKGVITELKVVDKFDYKNFDIVKINGDLYLVDRTDSGNVAFIGKESNIQKDDICTPALMTFNNLFETELMEIDLSNSVLLGNLSQCKIK